MKKLGKIEDFLSRDEMKQVQGGSGSIGSCDPPGWGCHRYNIRCCSGLCQMHSTDWGVCV